MTDQSNDNTLRWFQHKDIGIVSRPEVRFALPVLLDAVGLTPESTDLHPRIATAKARVPMSHSSPEYVLHVRDELSGKLRSILGIEVTVLITMESDDIHAWVTAIFNSKDVKQ